MIKSIKLENFRSLRKCSADFEPLTVIIGANGTGKSNVIKALDFISDVAQNGLEDTILCRGGFHELLPRSLTATDANTAVFKISTDLELPSPTGSYPDDAPRPTVCHELELSYSSTKVARITNESLTLCNPLSLMAFTRKPHDEAKYDSTKYLTSSIKFQREGKGKIIPIWNPRLDEDNVRLYAEALGVHWYLLDRDTDLVNECVKVVNMLLTTDVDTSQVSRTRKVSHRIESLLEIGPRFRWSNYLGEYLRELCSIKRYDLLLNELRRQQQSGRRQMLHDGRYMPSAAKVLRSEQKQDWSHMLSVLHDIAPHVNGVNIKSLQTTDEFVAFHEKSGGRFVESWEASDGTLRALAILIALEHQPLGGTILIEEPEMGLHPWAVRRLMAHVQDTVVRRGIQVIMTTHSTQVLESVEPKQVLVASRDANTGTTVESLSKIINDGSVERGEIGKLWDAGLIGGIPE